MGQSEFITITKVSRRNFLQASGSISGATFLRLAAPALAAITSAACTAEKEATAFFVLGAEESTDFAAIAARIIPTTDTPGAAEAGVIHFFDNAFADAMSEQHADAQNGLAEFDVVVLEQGPYRKAEDFQHDELSVLFRYELHGGGQEVHGQTFTPRMRSAVSTAAALMHDRCSRPARSGMPLRAGPQFAKLITTIRTTLRWPASWPIVPSNCWMQQAPRRFGASRTMSLMAANICSALAEWVMTQRHRWSTDHIAATTYRIYSSATAAALLLRVAASRQ
jgi:hypothetical protein